MAKKKSTKTTEIQVKPFTKVHQFAASDVPTYYVNSASIEISSFDVRFRLGQIQGVEEGALQIKEVVYLFMSHAHFKAFAGIVATNAAKIDEGIVVLNQLQGREETH